MFCKEDNILVTVSEDKTIKLWDTSLFQKANTHTDLEPYQTLREKNGHIFTITGTSLEQNSHLIFAGGSDGKIKIWIIRPKIKVEPYSTSQENNFSMMSIPAHKDAI